MKKAIIIIFCILTCNFFSVSYTLTSHKYFNHIVYAEKELPGFYSIQIPHDIMNNDSTQILHTVENCLDNIRVICLSRRIKITIIRNMFILLMIRINI